MIFSRLALFVLIAVSPCDGFLLISPSRTSSVALLGKSSHPVISYIDSVPTASSFRRAASTKLSAGGFLGQEVDDDDDDDDDETVGGDSSSSSSSTSKIYKQTMTPDERKQNLAAMRQIFKYDLNDLQARADYAGWVQARKDLKRRQGKDPWFELNNKLKEAVLQDLGDALIDDLVAKIRAVGGPPPGVTHKRKYATVAEIYDSDMSLGKAEAIVQMEQQRLNSAKWAKLLAEREANEKKQAEEDANTNPYLKAEEEARKRREKTMRILYGKVEEERKKKAAKAKEIQEKYGVDKEAFMGGGSLLDKAIESAKKQLEETKLRQQQKGGLSSTGAADTNTPISGTTPSDAAAAEEEAAKAAASSSSNNGKRIPGDMDMTRGEIDVDIVDSSDLTTNNVRVQVSTSYNAAQSDPPMRKHSFAYTIRITNTSPTDSIQLLSRKFEIQTVGARQKDVVKGEGVTGRQPILKPGEAFEYTSSVPLSVRPLGTTIAAARMAGEYQFNIVDIDEAAGKDADGNPVVKVLSGPLSCQLGTFHFIFPEDQRVKPVRRASDEEDDDDDEDDDDSTSTTSPKAATTSSANKPATSVASTPSLPGDEDMKSGKILSATNDSSEVTTDGVKVKVTSQYREERSDPKMDKHCFAYNIRITNENDYAIQLTGRKFEIQTIGSAHKDVVAGPGVTGRQPVLQPGESFEYTSTAPLSVHPLPTTSVVARMQGEYTFTKVGDSQPRQAKLAVFHFVLPALDIA
eukprot:CAMPEP_0172438042 /NCGR_PEP_ID=MMETSP1064-20121228/72582_1 /TAXON_ID=202472 /ORGANISM="Aulacoseira subarctica , Strain CCAP 1002/5" /LENGTH=744 /DNA_ID=CAMNT_0013186567 /DNA_START=120 /DNA_END=2354 /DNA_ORIENTATION=+